MNASSAGPASGVAPPVCTVRATRRIAAAAQTPIAAPPVCRLSRRTTRSARIRVRSSPREWRPRVSPSRQVGGLSDGDALRVVEQVAGVVCRLHVDQAFEVLGVVLLLPVLDRPVREVLV